MDQEDDADDREQEPAYDAEGDPGSGSPDHRSAAREITAILWRSKMVEEIHARLYGCMIVGSLALSDFFFDDRPSSNRVLALAVGVSFLLSGFAGIFRPHSLWFAADGFVYSVACCYFAVLTAKGTNYYSQWFPLDWILMALFVFMAWRSFRIYWRYAETGGGRLAAAGAFVWGVAGAAVILSDPFLPGKLRSHLDKAEDLFDRKQFAQAIAQYSTALALDPRATEAWYKRGAARRETGDVQGAIADFTVAIELDPKLTPAYLHRAMCKGTVKDWNGMFADANHVVGADPNRAEAYYLRGMAKVGLGNIEEGKRDLEEAFKRRPDLKEGLDSRLDKAR
jgi:tetratricopeptide (TPR) repeat protein